MDVRVSILSPRDNYDRHDFDETFPLSLHLMSQLFLSLTNREEHSSYSNGAQVP